MRPINTAQVLSSGGYVPPYGISDQALARATADTIKQKLGIVPDYLRVLLLDVDQTLVYPPEFSIQDFTRGVINRVHDETNVKATLMTGRHVGSIDSHINALGITIPVIASHGARVQQQGREPFYFEPIGDASASNIYTQFFNALRQQGLSENHAFLIYFARNGAIHEESSSPILRAYLARNHDLLNQGRFVVPSVHTYDNFRRNGEPEKVLIATDSPETAIIVKNELSARLSDPALQYLVVNDVYVEIVRSDVSKGVAGKSLLKYLDRERPGSALAFGDGQTDLSVARAGIPLVLLGNAPQDVKQDAEQINKEARGRGSNDLVAIVELGVTEEAVAKIVKALLLSNGTGYGSIIPRTILI